MAVNNVSVQDKPAMTASLRAVIFVLGASGFLAVLDGTAVTSSLPALSGAFGTDLAAVVWVTSVYLMAAGTALPLVGWASDRFGGRATFLAGLTLFVLGSVLVALSWSLPSLIAFRIVQGLGGGILEPASVALAARLAPSNAVGRVMSQFSMVINIAPVVGPFVGAALSDVGWWRMIFWLNVPLGVLIAVVSWRMISADAGRPDGPERAAAPDVLGMALLAPGVAGVLLAINRSEVSGSGLLVAVSGGAGVVLLAGYVVHALTGRRPPVLDLRLLSNTAYRAALLVMCCVGTLMYLQLSLLPVIAESRYGLVGFAQGLLTGSLGLGLLLSMSNAGSLSDQWGPRRLVVGGSVISAIGFATVAAVLGAAPLWLVMALLLAIGLGFGCVAAPTFASVYRTVGAAKAAQATTALFVAAQLFAAVGVTVTGLVLRRGAAAAATGYLVLAAVAVVAGLLAVRLPGRPNRAGAEGTVAGR